MDYCGAIALLIYLLYELYRSSSELLHMLSDVAPVDVAEAIARDLTSMSLEVRAIRIRRVSRDVLQGDIVIALDPRLSLEEAHRIADIVEALVRSKYGAEIVVHVEPRQR